MNTSRVQSHRSFNAAQVLKEGSAIGIAGGLAEVAVVYAQGAAGGVNAAEVARHVAAAVRLDSASAVTGLGVHMMLAVALGMAVSLLLSLTRMNFTRAAALYGSMAALLAVVWAVNFFVVLPRLSPSFVTLMPYAVTLFSKLMFGVAAAATLQVIRARGKTARRMELGYRTHSVAIR